MNNNQDFIKLQEAYEGLTSKREADIRHKYQLYDSSKQIHSDRIKQYEEEEKDEARKHLTHENYSDKELHQMCIVALKDLTDRMYPSDQARILPKVDWLISLLQKKV